MLGDYNKTWRTSRIFLIFCCSGWEGSGGGVQAYGWGGPFFSFSIKGGGGDYLRRRQGGERTGVWRMA